MPRQGSFTASVQSITMSGNHDHNNIARVQIALVLTGTFMIVELVGGIISGSLALLADAGHMLTDTMSLTLAAVAFRVSARPADSRRSYGYHRFQILAAFVNGLSLLVIVGWILIEAVRRFMAPTEVMGMTMLAVAAAGLVVNIVSFLVLHGGDRDNLNMRGAALHVAGDLLERHQAHLLCTQTFLNALAELGSLGSLKGKQRSGSVVGIPPSLIHCLPSSSFSSYP